VPDPKLFEFVLHSTEVDAIRQAKGTGGHQALHKSLVAELDLHKNKVTLTDEELGRLIRYMTSYGTGGFQGRLRSAFIRPLRELLQIP
jgi:hypothetical protein